MDKLRVVLCDANAQEAEAYAKLCRAVGEQMEMALELKIYTKSDDLLFDLDDSAFTAMVSILIVDPENGFAAIPATARKCGYDGLILYLSHSTSMERYHQAFDAEAFNYIQKGGDQASLSRFHSVFERALKAAEQLERQYIVVSCAGEYKQIDVKDIYYFEAAADHMICVWYSGGSFKFVSTLQNLEERLRDRGFIRVHRSYLVSLDAIHRLYSDHLTLNNGGRIPVSRNYAVLKTAMDRRKLL